MEITAAKMKSVPPNYQGSFIFVFSRVKALRLFPEMLFWRQMLSSFCTSLFLMFGSTAPSWLCKGLSYFDVRMWTLCALLSEATFSCFWIMGSVKEGHTGGLKSEVGRGDPSGCKDSSCRRVNVCLALWKHSLDEFMVLHVSLRPY